MKRKRAAKDNETKRNKKLTFRTTNAPRIAFIKGHMQPLEGPTQKSQLEENFDNWRIASGWIPSGWIASYTAAKKTAASI